MESLQAKKSSGANGSPNKTNRKTQEANNGAGVDKIEDKLDSKLDKQEFYKVLTLIVAIGGVVAALVM